MQFSIARCSICLEDFTGEASCRQLYCEHVYHGDCIDAWVIQHEVRQEIFGVLKVLELPELQERYDKTSYWSSFK